MSVVFHDVTFRYAGSTVPALDQVSTEVRRGEVALVTGRLGAGCSTMLMAAAGFAPRLTGGTLAGTVHTLEHTPWTEPGRQALAGRVGFLLPSPWTQLSGMTHTVRDEVAFGPANLGWPRERIIESVSRALAMGGVEHLVERDPATLSGGELQRVIFAGVVAMQPDVYLLDEPAAELDPEAANKVYDMLPALAETAIVMLATTDVDRAASRASRVILLDRGRVMADGAPEAVLGSVQAAVNEVGGSIPALLHMAECAPPFPITVDGVARRFSQ